MIDNRCKAASAKTLLLHLLLRLPLQVAGAAGSSRDARPIPGGAAELAKVCTGCDVVAHAR
jgi:hypothetical protein